MLTSVDKLIEEKFKDSFWLNQSLVCRALPSVTFHSPACLSFPRFTLCRDEQQCLVFLQLTQSAHQCCLHGHMSTAPPFIALAVWWRQTHILGFSPDLEDHLEMQHIGPYVIPSGGSHFLTTPKEAVHEFRQLDLWFYIGENKLNLSATLFGGKKPVLCLAWISYNKIKARGKGKVSRIHFKSTAWMHLKVK